MSVMLCTLLLNEMEWLPRLYKQHRNWPDLAGWVFVEAADRVYAETNPDLVSDHGLSVDGTTEFLDDLTRRDSLVTHVRHGITDNPDPAMCKVSARGRYLEYAEALAPDFLIILDADEFYTSDHQRILVDAMRKSPQHDAFVFHRREIWRPPSIADHPLFEYEAIGRFWNIPCCHWLRWVPGMMYRDCHNSPQRPDGTYLKSTLARFDRDPNIEAQMIHMGYSASRKMRIAKNRYYEDRGELADPVRRRYTDSRRSWISWQPGERLPDRGRVIPYEGPIPEVFREDLLHCEAR